MTRNTTAVLAALAISCGTGDHGKIQWGADHAKALAEARESGKPIVIFFSADW